MSNIFPIAGGSFLAPVLGLTGTPTEATVGKGYFFRPTPSGGAPNRTMVYSLSAGTLPDGLTFSTHTGTIRGSATAAVTTSGLAITVSDGFSSATLSGLSIVATAPAIGGGGGVTPPLPGQLVMPRIALIGPSTIAQNMYGAAGPVRLGWSSAGPLAWSLARSRRAKLIAVAQAATPYYKGDNQAVTGATLASYSAQITAAIAHLNATGAVPANTIFFYEPGRNDIEQDITLASYKSQVLDHIAQMRANGPAKIAIVRSWKKPTSNGGGWVSGGAYRQFIDDINAWLTTLVAGQSDLATVNTPSVLVDPASPDQDPYADVTRIGGTHYTSKGSSRAAPAFDAFLASVCYASSYPATPTENRMPALSGTTGTKTAVTGNVFDGWSAVQSVDTTSTVVASQVTIDGKPYQRIDVSNTQGIASANGGQTLLTSPAFAVPEGSKTGARLKCKVPATGVPYQLFFILQGGDATSARSALMAGCSTSDALATVGAAGGTFAAASYFDGTTDQDLWLETPSSVLGAVGGSSLSLSLMAIYRAGSAGQTLRVDVGEMQTFDMVA